MVFVAGGALPSADIREKMQRRVPKYMVPSEVRFLSPVAREYDGKTDRKSLTAMLAQDSV